MIELSQSYRPSKRIFLMIRMSVLFLIVLSQFSPTFAATGFLNGEEISGLNKICYYQGASGGFSKTVRAASICPLSADDGRGASYGGSSSNSSASQRPETSVTGFLSGERTSGLNKICFYDSARGAFTKTVRAAQICPISTKQ